MRIFKYTLFALSFVGFQVASAQQGGGESEESVDVSEHNFRDIRKELSNSNGSRDGIVIVEHIYAANDLPEDIELTKANVFEKPIGAVCTRPVDDLLWNLIGAEDIDDYSADEGDQLEIDPDEFQQDEVIFKDQLEQSETIFASTLMQVYPNPTSDYLQLDLALTEASTVYMQLIDLSGQLQFEAIIPLEAGSQAPIIHLDGVQSGAYIYQILIDNQRHQGRLQVKK